MSAADTPKKEGLQWRFKPYPAYKDSGVEWLGEIPEHWEVKPLKAVSVLQTGLTLGKEYQATSLVTRPYLRVANVQDGYLQLEDVAEVELPKDDATRYELRRGDVLMTEGGDYDKLGRGCVWSDQVPNCLHQNHIFAVRPQRKHLLPEFLALTMGSSYGRAYFTATSKQSTNLASTNSTKLRNFPLPLPGGSEQSSIATFLDRETARIDALVAKKQRLIELLQEQRTSIITSAVTKGLEESDGGCQVGSENFPEVPLGWEMRKLRRILAQRKRPVAVHPDDDYQEIGIRSWGRGIFHKDPVKGAWLEDKSVYRIEPGDFVLNIVFAWEGAAAVATEAERGMVGSHRFPTFLVSEDVDLDYLLMVFQVGQGRWLMEVNSPGSAGRNKTIRLNQFLDELIPLPPLATQQALVRRVREEEQRLADLTQKLRIAIARLQELRIALISAAVTGKIDVREEVV